MSTDGIPDGPVAEGSDEDELLAAEYALRVLDAQKTLALRGREASDHAFAGLVAAWNARLAPMLDEAAPAEPDAAIWIRIAAAIALNGAGGEIVALRSKIRFWRRAATGLTGIAAALALFLATSRNAPPAPPAPASTIDRTQVAALAPDASSGAGGAALAVVSYDPAGRSLVVTPAALTPAADRDYELWVIPADGRPRSLGLLDAGPPRRISLAGDLATAFGGRPTLAVSQERKGGSRTGQPEGPVVASGKLERV